MLNLFKTINLGATTNEPSLYDMVLLHYNRFYDAEVAYTLTRKYFDKLTKETQ